MTELFWFAVLLLVTGMVIVDGFFALLAIRAVRALRREERQEPFIVPHRCPQCGDWSNGTLADDLAFHGDPLD